MMHRSSMLAKSRNGRFRFSMQCTAAQPELGPLRVITRGSRARGIIVASSIAELTARAASASAVLDDIVALAGRAAVEGGVVEGGGSIPEGGLSQLLSCSAYVRSGAQGLRDASELRTLLNQTTPRPALAVVVAESRDDAHLSVSAGWPSTGPEEHTGGMLEEVTDSSTGEGGALLSLACTALLSQVAAGSGVGVRAGRGDAYAVVDRTHRLVYTDGLQLGVPNASGAFDGLDALLSAVGTDLSRVLACRFYLHAPPPEGYPASLFAGFQRTFCEDHPPPPTRAEYVAATVPEGAVDRLLGPDGDAHLAQPHVTAQCVAALPMTTASSN